MYVTFYDDKGNIVSTHKLQGETYEDVCYLAWEMIINGQIIASDFSVIDD